jgi:Lrp/AsnC family transcriptional regulator
VLERIPMDAIDRELLRIVQRDASLSIREISAEVGLSFMPCRRRLRRLGVSGVSKRRAAPLDPEKLGLTVFVSVEVADHTSRILADFTAKIVAMPEVTEFYRLAGDADYGLRVVVPDMASFDAFYKRLVESTPLKRVTSRIALENIKSETAYPIRHKG